MRRSYKLAVLIALTVFVTDQVTKALVLKRLALGESIEVLTGFFNIVRWHNTGAAFGMLGGGGFYSVLLIVLSFVAVGVIVYLYKYSDNILTYTALSLIIGGALGNLLDRVRYGEVIDFLDFFVGKYHWYAFNVADSAITVGVVIGVIGYYISEKRPEIIEDEG
ncbi:MAG: signal peptidase II [Deltaproteobacteria bacterium]|nr:signal peptidase II [Deltaproteobacteria bacterium]